MDNLVPRQIVRLINSGTVLLYVITASEQYSEQLLTRISSQVLGMGVPYVWSRANGLCREGIIISATLDPLKALNFAIFHAGPLFLIMKGVCRFWWNNPALIKKFKALAQVSGERWKVTVILGDDEWIPPRLRENIVSLILNLPGAKAL